MKMNTIFNTALVDPHLDFCLQKSRTGFAQTLCNERGPRYFRNRGMLKPDPRPSPRPRPATPGPYPRRPLPRTPPVPRPPPRYPVTPVHPQPKLPFGKRTALPYAGRLKFIPYLGWLYVGLGATDWLWLHGQGVMGRPTWAMGGNWSKLCGWVPAPPTYVGWPGPNAQDPVPIATTPLCGLGGQAFPGAQAIGLPTALGEWGIVFLTGPNGAGRYFINEMWNRPVGSANPSPNPIQTPPLPFWVFPPTEWPDVPRPPSDPKVVPNPRPGPDPAPNPNPDPAPRPIPYPAVPHVPPAWPSSRSNGPKSGPKAGPRPAPRPKRPKRGKPETKTKWSVKKQFLYDAFRYVQKWFHRTTEFADFIDAIGGTLEGYPKSEPLHKRAIWLFQNADRIDLNAAREGLMQNDIEDRVIGWFMGNAPFGATPSLPQT